MVLAAQYDSVDAILDDVVRQVGEYRTSTIRGHLFLHANESKYGHVIDGVALRGVPRREATNRYLALLRRRPGFARLIPPGTLGALTPFEPGNDPMEDAISLSARATVLEHLAELLADDRMLTVNIASFTWGAESADGFSFVEVLPLAFEPPVYGKSPLAPVPDIDYVSYYSGVLARFDVRRDVGNLIAALSHERVIVREAAAFHLARMRAEESAGAVRAMLSDSAMPVRLVAAEGLLGLGETSGFPAVVSAAVDSPDVDVRMAAITGLGLFARTEERRDAAVALLRKISGESDRFVRAAAVRALAASSAPDANAILRSLAGRERDAELKLFIERVSRTTPE